MEIKKISFIGCGALGIMYASHMLKTLSPEQVRFIAGRDRIDRYRNTEFYANGVRQDFRFVPPEADRPPSDLVIFTVKSYGLDDAVRLAKDHIGRHTVILSFLNGISSEEIIGRAYDPAKVIPCMVAGMDATKTGASVNFSNTGYVAFGGLPRSVPEDLDALARFFERVRIRYQIETDITRAIWWKFMVNIGINPASALLRSTYGLFQTSAHAEKLMTAAMRELYEISRKLGVGLEERDIDDAIGIIRTLSPDGKTSMLQDIEANRRTEIDIFAGALTELGREHDVPVPVNAFLYNAVKALEDQNDHAIRVQRLTKRASDELKNQTAAIAALADEIWREHFTPIVGAAQVGYMLAKFQSAGQIYTDITENGYTYFTAREAAGGALIGYCGVAPREDHLLLSKIYVRRDFRGKGAARRLFDEASAFGKREYGFDKIRLSVNRHNDIAIRVYKKIGFKVVDSVVTDIGGGFFMDDYVMEFLAAGK